MNGAATGQSEELLRLGAGPRQRQADMATVKVEHDFAGAKLVNTALWQDQAGLPADLVHGHQRQPQRQRCQHRSGQLDHARTNLTTKDQLNEILTNQTTLTADFTTGAFKHTVVSGLELTNEKDQLHLRQHRRQRGLSRDQHLPPEPEHADQRGPGQPAAQRRPQRGTTNTQSVYVFDTIKWRAVDLQRRRAGRPLQHQLQRHHRAAIPPQVVTPWWAATSTSDNLINGKLSALYKNQGQQRVRAGGLVESAARRHNFALSTAASSAANPKFDPQKPPTTKWAPSGTCWARSCRWPARLPH
jgi:catecholate siderophore receptor